MRYLHKEDTDMMIESSIAQNRKSTIGDRETHRWRRELEMLAVTAVMAMIIALGMLLFVIALLEVRIEAGNSTLLVSIYFTVTGVIWGMLILRNR